MPKIKSKENHELLKLVQMYGNAREAVAILYKELQSFARHGIIEGSMIHEQIMQALDEVDALLDKNDKLVK